MFAGSAALPAPALGLIAAPLAENAPARRMAVLGALGELAASNCWSAASGSSRERCTTGRAGTRLRAAKVLSAAGALGAATIARRSRGGAAATGAALLAGSALTRFGLFAAGMASARDPRHTVEPQRQRRAARLDASASERPARRRALLCRYRV